jgi:DNA-binding transcriptional regulator YiaG
VRKSKYQLLHNFLYSCKQHEVSLSFKEVERLLGKPLPQSARANNSWWSNRRKGALQASSWLDAGYSVSRVDLENQTVTFSKSVSKCLLPLIGGIPMWDGIAVKSLRIHMGLNQSQFAEILGVRQQTISDWETGIYQPSRAMSKHISLIAESNAFKFEMAK